MEIYKLAVLVCVLCALSSADGSIKRVDFTSRTTQENTAGVQAASVFLFGTVLDSEANGVEKAEISAEVTGPSGQTLTAKAVTDENGRFKITANGELLHIINISKQGYVYDRRKTTALVLLTSGPEVESPSIFDSNLFYLQAIEGPAVVQAMYSWAFIKTKPMTYTLDLTSEGGILSKAQRRRFADSNPATGSSVPATTETQESRQEIMPVSFRSGSGRSVSLFSEPAGKPVMPGSGQEDKAEPAAADVSVSARYSEGEGYLITAAALKAGDGLILSDKLLTEAPGEGYRQAVSWTQKEQKDSLQRYLYVKARDGEVYARLTVSPVIYTQSLLLKVTNLANRGGLATFDFTLREHPDKARLWQYEQRNRQADSAKPEKPLLLQKSR